LTLSLPHKSEKDIELRSADRRGPDALKERLTTTKKLDDAERAQRWADDKKLVRLHRGLPGEDVDGIELGRPKAEVKKFSATSSSHA